MTLKNIKYVKRHILEKSIHLTPITGMIPVNTNSKCNHFTQLTYQFNALSTVTQLHLGGVCEN
mgnify:CR=1 FL=1